MFWVVIINRSTYDVKNMGWERILHLKFTVISNLELNYGFFVKYCDINERNHFNILLVLHLLLFLV